MLAIDTRAVLASVDARLHPAIQLILEDRLLHLEERDRRLSTSSGSGCEPIVEPDESESMQWLRGQMREAFPQRSATNSSRSLTLTTRHRRTSVVTPQTFATQPPGDTGVTFRDRPMGGRELAHLLKRRVIWRVLQMFPRELVLALRTVSREHRDLGELATNNLALRQPTHEHESPRSATGMLS
ncbi:MAG TPA: hypothetical protein VFW38_05480 [Solirubrobacteraceae bacterium]|nr:hypothetical protein [Solirubrobacteraceae bacterium]